MTKLFQIYFDGEKTNRFYEAEAAEEALKEYKEDCIEEYKRDFDGEPDTTAFDYVEAVEAILEEE